MNKQEKYFDNREIGPKPPEQKAAEETDKNLEYFADSKISAINAEINRFDKSGRDSLQKTNESVGLSLEKFENIRKNSGVEGKLSAVTGKAKKLADVAKGKLKMAAVIGMSAIALAGAGEFNKAEAGDAKSDTIKTEKLLAAKYGKEDRSQTISFDEDGLSTDADSGYIKRKKELAKKTGEDIKQEMIKHTESGAYYRKLLNEYYDPHNWYKSVPEFVSMLRADSNARLMRKNRINNLKTSKIGDVLRLSEMKDKYYGNKKAAEGKTGVLGFYETDKHEVNIPFSRDDVTYHEFGHAATKANYDISTKAMSILHDSYNEINSGNKNEDKDRNQYLSNPAERIVRKWAADRDMEMLGIKEYDEKFTQEHYKKLMDYYNKKELSKDAEEFIKTTKPKFEYFEKIFNEIAKNEAADKPLNA